MGVPTASWQLDNQDVTVSFSVDSGSSMMPLASASRIFGLTPDSPGMSAVADTVPPQYDYRFKHLTGNGVTIINPLIRLYGSTGNTTCDGQARFNRGRLAYASGPFRCYAGGDVMLGLRELTQLHLFFDFPNRKLYFTAADAH